jgi:hypothetical protein
MKELARADRALHDRYVDIAAFLQAVRRFWPVDGYRTAADGRTHVVCCPACRPRMQPSWARFPVVVSDGPGPGWSCFPSCGCSPTAIARALIAAERRELDAELARLAEPA